MIFRDREEKVCCVSIIFFKMKHRFLNMIFKVEYSMKICFKFCSLILFIFMKKCWFYVNERFYFCDVIAVKDEKDRSEYCNPYKEMEVTLVIKDYFQFKGKVVKRYFNSEKTRREGHYYTPWSSGVLTYLYNGTTVEGNWEKGRLIPDAFLKTTSLRSYYDKMNMKISTSLDSFYRLTKAGDYFFAERKKSSTICDSGEFDFRVKSFKQVGKSKMFCIGCYPCPFIRYSLKDLKKICPKGANAYMLDTIHYQGIENGDHMAPITFYKAEVGIVEGEKLKNIQTPWLPSGFIEYEMQRHIDDTIECDMI